MRRIKIMSALVALTIAALGTPVAFADPFTDCVNECADQFADDKAACDQALADRLAELDQQAADCNNEPDLISVFDCLRIVERQRQIAQNDHKRCISEANTRAWNCFLACQQSPSAP